MYKRPKSNGYLVQASSREIKTNFTELDYIDILKKLDQLTITQWSYKKDNGKIDHVGPVSEDFYHVFGLGENNKGISSVDTSGVALAAIKALKAENDLKTQEIAQLKTQNAVLINRLSAIETKYAEIDDIKQKLLAIAAMNYGDQITQQITNE